MTKAQTTQTHKLERFHSACIKIAKKYKTRAHFTMLNKQAGNSRKLTKLQDRKNDEKVFLNRNTGKLMKHTSTNIVEGPYSDPNWAKYPQMAPVKTISGKKWKNKSIARVSIIKQRQVGQGTMKRWYYLRHVG